MNIRNEDIKEVLMEIPEGHKHIRTKIVLQDGSGFELQEASVANIVRAYVTLKTDARKKAVALRGKRLEERKEGYAEWQLTEEPAE